MFLKSFFIQLVLVMLVFIPQHAYAESDSTRIGISVEIKSKQVCDYSYSLENSENLNSSSNSSFIHCDVNASKLQQTANQVASSELSNTTSKIDGKQLRVFMTVQ